MLDLPESRFKHFSFILMRNKTLSVGYNLGFTTHPLAKKYGYRFSSIHSELKAIKNFPYSLDVLSKCKMVNIRIMKNKKLGMAKPCHICSKLLLDFELNEIWYTDEKGKFKLVKNNV